MLGIKKDKGRTLGNKLNVPISTIGIKMTPTSHNQVKQISNDINSIDNNKSNSKEIIKQPLGLKNKAKGTNKQGLEKQIA